MFDSNVTPAIIVAGAAGLGFGSPEQIYLIQMAMLFAGITTLFQTIGIGPVGAHLPIMQGTSFAFVGVFTESGCHARVKRGANLVHHRRPDPFCAWLGDQQHSQLIPNY